MIERRYFNKPSLSLDAHDSEHRRGEGARGHGVARSGRSSMLDELIEAIGEPAALKLVESFGGVRVYVPQMPEPEDVLSQLIGTEATLKLAQIYGGERLELPHPNSRRGKILSLRRMGLSVDSIALQAGCTRRRVFQVLAEERKAYRAQADLRVSPSGSERRFSQ